MFTVSDKETLPKCQVGGEWYFWCIFLCMVSFLEYNLSDTGLQLYKKKLKQSVFIGQSVSLISLILSLKWLCKFGCTFAPGTDWKYIWAPGKADQKGFTITKGWNHCSTPLGVHTCTQGISCIWEWINTLAFLNSCLTGRFPGLKPFSITCQTGVFWLNETMSEHVHVCNK